MNRRKTVRPPLLPPLALLASATPPAGRGEPGPGYPRAAELRRLVAEMVD